MLSGTGEITSDEPIIDELFGLRIQNAVRISRTVEVNQYEPKKEEKPLQKLPCDRNETEEDDKDGDED